MGRRPTRGALVVWPWTVSLKARYRRLWYGSLRNGMLGAVLRKQRFLGSVSVGWRRYPDRREYLRRCPTAWTGRPCGSWCSRSL
jgi:hypothetical protein